MHLRGSLHRVQDRSYRAVCGLLASMHIQLFTTAMGRYKSIERPPVGKTVQIEVDGQRYEGTYTVDGSIVSVDTLLLGGRRGSCTDGSPQTVAKVLLLELVLLHQKRSA